MPSRPAAAGRAAGALTAVAALSTAVAAQAGVLPRPVQNLAHHIDGAPQARPPALPAVVRATPVGSSTASTGGDRPAGPGHEKAPATGQGQGNGQGNGNGQGQGNG